ncbi:hypothetical protein INT47_005613 [Mucor saturninus]|uniref:Uncharacterized protein n=1 Tax=Mucor saturninus TaxID=64648 RepID=A0A8H7QNW1_9FUNG|nr:hypothetical protein INT47_005613 [Mucor saturninus]
MGDCLKTLSLSQNVIIEDDKQADEIHELLSGLETKRVLNSGPGIPKLNQYREFFLKWDDEEFVKMCRRKKESFLKLLRFIEDHPVFNNKSFVVQTDVQIQLAVTIDQIVTLFGIGKGSVTNYTQGCFKAINDNLGHLMRWPNEEQRELSTAAIKKYHLFRNCIGYIDVMTALKTGLMVEKEVQKFSQRIKRQLGESSVVRIVEHDKLYVPEKEESVGSIIKTKACTLRKDYHHLDFNAKAIISLGLNSILDLSHKYPDAQSTLFDNRQWLHLQHTNRPKKYVYEEYAYINNILKPIFEAYNPAKTSDQNWTAIYIQAKKLIEQNDPEIDINKKDVSF